MSVSNEMKVLWANFNRSFSLTLRGRENTCRHVTILNKVFFVPQGTFFYCRGYYEWLPHEKRYALAGDTIEQYRCLSHPGDLVLDRGARSGLSFGTVRAFRHICRFYGKPVKNTHFRQLLRDGVTYWRDVENPNDRNIFLCFPMTAELAEMVNAMGQISNLAGPGIKPVVTQDATGNVLDWHTEKQPNVLAVEGDMLLFSRLKDNTDVGYGIPYLRGSYCSRAFFDERARFIDNLF